MYRLRPILSALAVITMLTTMLVALPVAAAELTMDRLATVGADSAEKYGDAGAKAADEITKALDPDLWIGDTLGEDGKKAFDAMRKAAKELDKAGAGDQVAELVAIAKVLAAGQILVAPDVGGDHMDKANQAMAKAEAKMAEGKPDDAIKELLKAWKEAAKARDQKDSGGGGGGGSYAVYVVTFVEAHPAVGSTPKFMTRTGTNEFGTPGYTGRGNEGYLFSSAFRPKDSFHGASLTYEVTPGVWEQGIQLHVSCSDAFPLGYGAKSDPSMDATWIVNTMSITKFSNGQVDKQCEIVGAGLEVPVDVPPGDDGGSDDG